MNAEFTSQVATTLEQSKHLLELGFNPTTADLYYSNADSYFENPPKFKLYPIPYEELLKTTDISKSPFTFIPAWSLYRLIEIASRSYFTNYIDIHFSMPITRNLYDEFIDLNTDLIKQRVIKSLYLINEKRQELSNNK